MVKRVYPQGRISIPIKWRRGWKSDQVVLHRLSDRIEVIPLEPTPPSTLFDSIDVGDEVDLTDPHSMRRALLEPDQ